MMVKICLVIICLLVAPFATYATELIIDDFSDLSDWHGDFQKVDYGLFINGKATKEVLQDWSGYKNLELIKDGENEVEIIIEDADGERWLYRMDSSGTKAAFSDFALLESDNSGDKRLSAGNIQELTITGTAKLREIGLSGSKGFNGPNVYIQTANKYFAGKTWEKVALEVKSKGFTAVHLTPVELTPATYYKQKEMVDAFHKAGLPVALTIYPGTDFYAYNAFPHWRQKFLDGGGSSWSWRVYSCLREEEFIDYTIDYLQEQFSEYGYDALHISEPWLEVWGGPENPKYYSCFCERCSEAFEEIAGIDPALLFDRNSDYYYKKNTDLYKKWQDFRVDSVTTFVEKIIAGLREVKPEVPAFVMFLSDVTVDPGKTREYQAMDLERFAEIGDAVIIETAWQDWTRKDIWPGYIISYGQEYSPRVFKADPEAKIFAQPDVGSNWDEMHRSPEWLRQFSAYAYRFGFDGYIVYEYSQMGYRMLPSTEIVLDDFEKPESGAHWTSVNSGYDEVLAGRVTNNSFEGEGSLMLYFSGDESEVVGVEKDVMLDLTGFDYFEVEANFDSFQKGDIVTLQYEIVTTSDRYVADIKSVVDSGWQNIKLPFGRFEDQLDLSHVNKIRICLRRDEDRDSFGRVYFDLLKVGGSRRSLIEGQGLPISVPPRLSTFISVKDITVEVLGISLVDQDLAKVELGLVLSAGERSFGSLKADIVVYDILTGAELPKLGQTIEIGALRRETEKKDSINLILPEGEFEIRVRLYTRGLDYLNRDSEITISDGFYIKI